MHLTVAHISPIVAVVAGILILIAPRRRLQNRYGSTFFGDRF